MLHIRRRWQSIDRKLPVLASGLVVLTTAVLATTAYVMLEHALLNSAGRRLSATARFVTQLAGRPGPHFADAPSHEGDAILRSFLLGQEPASRALSVLAYPRG